MSKSKKIFSMPIFLTQLSVVLLMIIVGIVFHEALPRQIPAHWNTAGQVDSYMDKTLAVILFPSITLLIVVLFPLLSSIDPRKKNYESFLRPWHIVQMAIVAFFAYLYFVILYLAFNPSASIETFVFVGIGTLFIIIGNYLGKMRQNYFVGIKTPWTLNNEKVWNKTQRIGGWSFLIAGLIVLINGFVQWQLVASMIFSVALAVVFPIGYSYYAYRRFTESHK